MSLTPEGEEFIGYAKSILRQIDDVELLYKQSAPKKQKFSVSVPRACYIADAFVEFSKTVDSSPAELFYKETNSKRTIDNVLNKDYRLGIIRYAENYDQSFKSTLEEKGLSYEMLSEFTYTLIMSKNNPLADRQVIHFDDLTPYIEIAHADPYVPTLPLSKVVKEELPDNILRRIFIFERASQYDLLSENPETFMWVSPASARTLSRYGLVQRECADNKKKYRDVLIYKTGYRLSQLDRQFIAAVHESKKQYLS